jgi:hypothetical protein
MPAPPPGPKRETTVYFTTAADLAARCRKAAIEGLVGVSR